MTNESTNQLLGLAFLSWDLFETRPVFVNRAVPNALRQEGKMGLLAGLHAHGVLLAEPKRAADLTQKKKKRKKKVQCKSSAPNPRFQRVYFTTIICSVFAVPGIRNINTVATSESLNHPSNWTLMEAQWPCRNSLN